MIKSKIVFVCAATLFLSCKKADVVYAIPEIREVKASSFSEEKYSPEKVIDKGWQSWVEGKSDDGKGEWIELTFDEPVCVDGFSFKNGFGNLAFYWSNNRVKEAHIVFDDDEKHPQKVVFEDTPVIQYVYLNTGKNGNSKKHSKFKLVIDSVYPGTGADNDTCISEIFVNGFFSGACYHENSVQFAYDPETRRMLRGLYEMDAGKENLKENEDGVLQVQYYDYEEGESYLFTVSDLLYGSLDHDYSPGNSGGGLREHDYKIYLQPDGRHILFTYYTLSNGREEYYDSGLKTFVWENKAWKEISENWNESFLKPLNDLKKILDEKALPYNISIKTADEMYDEESFNFKVYFDQVPMFFLNFCFNEKDYRFLDYEKDIYTVAALGKPENFENNPELLGQLKKEIGELSGDYYRISPLNLAAMLNSDPAMCEYLIKAGYPVGPTGYSNRRFSALEAWKNGNNSVQVRDALIKNGASYSANMLISAVQQHDKKSFSELLGMVKDYGPLWCYLCHDYLGNFYDIYNFEDFKFYISELSKTGFDLNQDYFTEQGRNEGGIMEAAIENYNLDAVKYLYSAGVKIPEEFNTTFDGRTPVEYCVKKYVYNSKTSDEEKARGYKNNVYSMDAFYARKILDFILSTGVDLNSPSNRPLHLLAESQASSKYSLEMAELLVQKGIDVNAINNKNYNALGLLVYEELHSEEEDSAEEKRFADFLLSVGSYPEYAVLACLETDAADVYLNKKMPDYSSKNRAEYFEKYLKLCKNRSIQKYADSGTVKETSLLACYLDDYIQSHDDLSDDEMLLKLSDAGFKFIYETNLTARLIKRLGFKLNDTKRAVLKKYFDDVKNPDVKECSGILFGLTASLIRGHKLENEDEIMEMMMEHGADINYEFHDYWILNDAPVTTVNLLLAPNSEYLKDEKWTSDYVKVCRLFISKGAQNILTEAAFAKAKVSRKVIAEIFTK